MTRITALLLLCLAAAPAWAETRTVATHGDWTVYRFDEKDAPVCFISAAPAQQAGKFTKRDPVAFFVTRWSGTDKNVISVNNGYTFKDKSAATVTIGKDSLSLFTQGDKAWTANAAADEALVKALRGGDKMTVKGASTRGTETTDTYSLKGISAALKALDDCGGK